MASRRANSVSTASAERVFSSPLLACHCQRSHNARAKRKAAFGGGADKAARVAAAVTEYLTVARELSPKVSESLLALCDEPILATQWEALAYFQTMLDKHTDLVDRRLLQGERIAASEKVYSLFEPHTEWITKGKLHPSVELGHRLLVASDQHGLIQDYDELIGQVDVDQSVPVADRLLGRYGAGSIASISFDKGSGMNKCILYVNRHP